VLNSKKRYKIEGISMNKFFYFKNGSKIIDKRSSENFISGHGVHHKDIIKNFLDNKLEDLRIHKNLYSLKLIHSIYIAINKKLKYFSVQNKQSKLGI